MADLVQSFVSSEELSLWCWLAREMFYKEVVQWDYFSA